MLQIVKKTGIYIYIYIYIYICIYIYIFSLVSDFEESCVLNAVLEVH